MKTVLTTGASGLLGRAILRALAPHTDWQVRGTGFSRAAPPLDRLNLRDRTAVTAYIKTLRPDVIIHSAAERRPEVSEKDPTATEDLNVAVTRDLARLAAGLNAWMIYLSTDYVFDGTQPPYHPDDPTHPLNTYGRSKRDGELAMREELRDGAILRVPILYGEVERLSESAVTIIAENILQGRKPLTLDDWAVRYPTLTDDVAVVCRQMVEHRFSNPGFAGTFHWSGNEPMTKYGMAMRMAPLLGYDPACLRANPAPGGGPPRPRNARLDCAILEALGMGQRTPFAEAIVPILRPHQR